MQRALYGANNHLFPPEKLRCLVEKMGHRGLVEEVAKPKVSNL